jgi:hypothetical protein
VEIIIDDGVTVTYDFDELDDLTHAYAISVHRSQGSEYPFVVAPLIVDFGGINWSTISRTRASSPSSWLYRASFSSCTSRSLV